MSESLETYLRRKTGEYAHSYAQWAQEMYYIRDKTNKLITLHLNYVQAKISEIEEREMREKGNVRIYILKGRQGGISTDQQARALHLCKYNPGANAMTLAHSIDDTAKLFEITRRAVREMVERFPELLPTMGRGDTKEVTFPGIDTKFWTGTAGAKRIGRGVTLTRFHGSEFAFWEHPRQVISSITPALIPNGSTIVLETTPDREGSEAHEFWNEAVRGENGYVAVFFPWWECDPVHYRLRLLKPDELGELTDEEKVLQETAKLDLEQLKWRRHRMKEMGKMEFIREYPEDPDTCWITGGKKFYDAELIWTLLRQAPQPKERIAQPWGGEVQVFGDVDTGIILPNGKLGIIREDVIIGADVAEGVGGDRSTFTARSFPSWRLLATFGSNIIDPSSFASLLYYWGLKKFPEALLVVEKNMHGITVLRELRDLHYPRRSIYHRTPLNKIRDDRTEYIGWTTTGESKPLMLDVGRELLRAAGEDRIDIPSREALRDAWAVADAELGGRDVFVSEILCWIGREYLVRRRAKVLAPLHW